MQVVPRQVVVAALGLVVLLAVSETVALPVLSRSALPLPMHIAVAVIGGAAMRVGLGVFVSWRLRRTGGADVNTVVHTIVAGVLAGLVCTWVAGWMVVRPQWGAGEWVGEVGLFVVGAASWVVPAAGAGYWFIGRGRASASRRAGIIGRGRASASRRAGIIPRAARGSRRRGSRWSSRA